ncbi:hypothetical protein ASPACDRAFT_48539 [Aspergillus aculeatus ATCC 16872]|uniref:Uncharacterized protein n=1 Tax=Aspergillus aculeatus (strain ATCC 16872 / CBS 172.66 / WB 5094) TaxID=690307 RepID=A0A1L9WEW4_ASPA1|nr:uncharacterized protein ASPACDRAFT_48539 [Aspergillus aculeatus ATCC 16872]OJJ94711.1 hypothetical protein ASPACDRAFT_48539 [Aspergillus aculeatus ATCC 16872]
MLEEKILVADDLSRATIDLLPKTRNDLSIHFESFYGVKPRHVSPLFKISLSDLSYQPKVERPTADWAVTAAFQAFRSFQLAGYSPVRRFATIGTGSGTDAVGALEVFFPELVSITMTDLSPEVAATAKLNLISAVHDSRKTIQAVALEATSLTGYGLEPLKGQQVFDLIDENLPNIPLPEGATLLEDQTSSTYFSGADVPYQIPPFVSSALLDLHYTSLVQARAFSLLSASGVILSSIGGRVPIATILSLADTAGFAGRILSMSWKVQSEPESVIGGYATQQQQGLGPFYFYRTTTLRRTFHGRTPAGAALRALQIERELLSERIDAIAALELHQEGVELGHPVVVMASVLK